MTELAISNQYSLLANVHCNAIFVRHEYLNLFHDREVTPDEVFTYEGHGVSELSFNEMRSLGWRRVIEKISRRLCQLFSPLRSNSKL